MSLPASVNVFTSETETIPVALRFTDGPLATDIPSELFYSIKRKDGVQVREDEALPLAIEFLIDIESSDTAETGSYIVGVTAKWIDPVRQSYGEFRYYVQARNS